MLCLKQTKASINVFYLHITKLLARLEIVLGVELS